MKVSVKNNFVNVTVDEALLPPVEEKKKDPKAK